MVSYSQELVCSPLAPSVASQLSTREGLHVLVPSIGVSVPIVVGILGILSVVPLQC
jgi:hypothetical protein